MAQYRSRYVWIHATVTPEEKKQIVSNARRNRMNLSEYLRYLGLANIEVSLHARVTPTLFQDEMVADAPARVERVVSRLKGRHKDQTKHGGRESAGGNGSR